MKILVISGFLGAGKTTFIHTLSKKLGRDFVVMENEYGKIGIDGNLLQADRLKVWELTEGCICCSLESDFASSILTISNTVNPEYLVVEPTGVGLLSAVMRNIGKIEYERIQLLEPLTIVDVHCVDDYILKFGDLYTDQIKNASRLLLSKIEHTKPAEIDRITTVLRMLNPYAEIVNAAYQRQPLEWWHSLLERPYNKSQINPREDVRSPDLESVSVTDIAIASLTDLMELLVAFMRGFFGTVYRVKGYVSIKGQWTKFDVTNKQYTVAICHSMSKAMAVVIGCNLQHQQIRSAFFQHTGTTGN